MAEYYELIVCLPFALLLIVMYYKNKSDVKKFNKKYRTKKWCVRLKTLIHLQVVDGYIDVSQESIGRIML